jgi:hypothetical protein
MKKLYVIITIFVFTTTVSFGQDFNKEFEFDGSDNTKEYTMKVSEGLISFKFILKSKLTEGYIYVELIDANNNIKGRFSAFFKKKVYAVKAIKPNKTKYDFFKVIKENKDLKYDIGELQKIIRNPTYGDWTIKIKSDNAKGTVLIKTEK